MPTMVLVLDQFGTLSAMAEKEDSWTVHLPPVENTNMGIGATARLSMLFTLMILESDVKVYLQSCIAVYVYCQNVCSLQ